VADGVGGAHGSDRLGELGRARGGREVDARERLVAVAEQPQLQAAGAGVDD